MLPLAVKKNKFGQRVADIGLLDYYGQIMEEVLEAYIESVIAEYSTEKDANEAEELADVITCCVTRLSIIKSRFVKTEVEIPQDFYQYLAKTVLLAYDKAKYEHEYESAELSYIINLCITRLEIIGYDAKKREKIYKAVNDKNRKRGYFED